MHMGRRKRKRKKDNNKTCYKDDELEIDHSNYSRFKKKCVFIMEIHFLPFFRVIPTGTWSIFEFYSSPLAL